MSASADPLPPGHVWWPPLDDAGDGAVLIGPWDDSRGPEGDGADPDGADPGTEGLDTLVLTDEELLALEARSPVVPLPWADERPSEWFDPMVTTALRGLLARGLIRAVDDDSMEVQATLAALLMVRAGAPVIAVIRRDVGAAVTEDRRADAEQGDASCGSSAEQGLESLIGLRHLFVAGEQVVIEDVTESGLHVFAITDLADLEPAVAAFIDIDGAPPGEGDPIDFGISGSEAAGGDEAATARLAALGGPTTLADTVIRDATGAPGEGHLVTIALGPGGTFVAESTLLRRAADGASAAPVRFEPTSVEAVAARVADLVLDANRRVTEAAGQVLAASTTIGG